MATNALKARHRPFGDYPKPKLDDLPNDKPPPRGGGWKTAYYRHQKQSFPSWLFAHSPFPMPQRLKGLEKSLNVSQREQRRQQRDMKNKIAARQEKPDPAPNVTASTGASDGADAASGLALSPTLLLEVNQTEQAEDVAIARIEGLELSSVEFEGLEDFFNLVEIRAGHNRLKLEDFSVFPALRSLELPLNHITNLRASGVAQLRWVTRLDLSHNKLSKTGLRALGTMPALRELDLTHNELRALPINLGEDNGGRLLFLQLRRLWLDDNQLHGPSVFQALAPLPNLRHVTLERNRIRFVPFLQAADGSYGQAFEALEQLGLAHNRLHEAADIIAVATWPCLQAIHVWENPLVYQKRGLPAELVEALTHRNGIEIVTEEPQPQRPAPMVDRRALRSVDASVPTLPALPPPPSAMPAEPRPLDSERLALPPIAGPAIAVQDFESGMDSVGTTFLTAMLDADEQPSFTEAPPPTTMQTASTPFGLGVNVDDLRSDAASDLVSNLVEPAQSLGAPPSLAPNPAPSPEELADPSALARARAAMHAGNRPQRLQPDAVRMPANPYCAPRPAPASKPPNSLQRRASRGPTVTHGSRNREEALRLLGLLKEKKPAPAEPDAQELLSLIGTMPAVDAAHSTAIASDPEQVVAALEVAKYRGFEQLLLSSDDEDDVEDDAAETNGAGVSEARLPANPRMAAKALEHALQHPPRLRDRAQHRLVKAALRESQQQRKVPAPTTSAVATAMAQLRLTYAQAASEDVAEEARTVPTQSSAWSTSAPASVAPLASSAGRTQVGGTAGLDDATSSVAGRSSVAQSLVPRPLSYKDHLISRLQQVDPGQAKRTASINASEMSLSAPTMSRLELRAASSRARTAELKSILQQLNSNNPKDWV
ncbi:uncharacterized protein MONBRDRAFT_29661 [Monosiga brevicollis MX1]|uniref:Uncharacterized protein n=1 Tax=Monosiga brevicollis TaxID=81824 RepID=A9VBR9_MONBE|nr:uncharacterized protein MONBRDRAFT_29661 [Monosiga brevicollis MX1]EDQ84981.1 predicted protein [Monosiga brevicollis MX1]|eukprot:XP_001750151.1 hypothetical protein [Monosiga brevicollis MX1]